MHFYLLGSWCDLDPAWPVLRSNVEIDLSRSKSTCFEPAGRGEHDGAIIIFIYPTKKVINGKNTNTSVKMITFHWWPLESKLLTLCQIWSKNVTGPWWELSSFFLFLLAVILLGKILFFCENCYFLKILPLVTSILTWPENDLVKVWDLVAVYLMPFTACS